MPRVGEGVAVAVTGYRVDSDRIPTDGRDRGRSEDVNGGAEVHDARELAILAARFSVRGITLLAWLDDRVPALGGDRFALFITGEPAGRIALFFALDLKVAAFDPVAVLVTGLVVGRIALFACLLDPVPAKRSG